MAQGGMKKLLIVTDAWSPQTNGVVTTLNRVIEQLASRGIQTEVIHPGLFKTVPTPGYAEIRMAWNPWKFGRLYRQVQPDYVHIATEGTLGCWARCWLKRRKLAFTTSLHTRFPEYINERLPLVPLSWGYGFLRWFHRAAVTTLVTTASCRDDLESKGFTKLRVWGRGVDVDAFAPSDDREHPYHDPLLLYVGRVAVEKNLRAFLDLQLFGKKVVVGDGPSMKALKREYPDVVFTGYRYGDALAAEYARADVFVFPSLTDTFGLVMLEAMACGTPVAAYPVCGPIDVVEEGVNGALDDDLEAAVKRALQVPRRQCRDYALAHSWQRCAEIFAETLVNADQTAARCDAVVQDSR